MKCFCCFSDIPTWNLYLGDEIVASGEYADMKTARPALIQAAVDELKRYCFTVVRVSDKIFSATTRIIEP